MCALMRKTKSSDSVGIAIATFVATTLTLAFLLWVANRVGFRFSTSTYVILALPAAVSGGLLGCTFVMLVSIYAIAVPGALITETERETLRSIVFNRLGRRAD